MIKFNTDTKYDFIDLEKYWTCPFCGSDLVKINDGYLLCRNPHCPAFMDGPLREAPISSDLPNATPLDYKRYCIEGQTGWWEYAIGQHKKALNRKPAPGVVLARVNTGKKVLVRAFRVSDAPRRRVFGLASER